MHSWVQGPLIVQFVPGKFALPPKKDAAREKHAEDQALTKDINLKNESNAASKAEQLGGRLGVVKAPPVQPADMKGSKRDRRK